MTKPTGPHPANVLRLEPSAAERAAFNEIGASREWDGVLSIADLDDYEDALRLFAWFGRRVDTLSGAVR